jgi:hypothetical protein
MHEEMQHKTVVRAQASSLLLLLTGFHVETGNVVEVVSVELPSKDVQRCPDDTGSMRMTGCRQKTEDGRLVPFLANGVKDIEGVATLVLCILTTKIYCSFRRQCQKEKVVLLQVSSPRKKKIIPILCWFGPDHGAAALSYSCTGQLLSNYEKRRRRKEASHACWITRDGGMMTERMEERERERGRERKRGRGSGLIRLLLTHDVVAQGDGGVSRGRGWRVASCDREELAMKGF